MSDGRDKHQSRENRLIVRRLLVEEWDPIGVRGIPEASDEYDTYADAAYAMLVHDGADASVIERYLIEIASDHMGLGRRPDIAARSRAVATRLVALKPRFLAH